MSIKAVWCKIVGHKLQHQLQLEDIETGAVENIYICERCRHSEVWETLDE